jgi:hypothetical protein
MTGVRSWDSGIGLFAVIVLLSLFPLTSRLNDKQVAGKDSLGVVKSGLFNTWKIVAS